MGKIFTNRNWGGVILLCLALFCLQSSAQTTSTYRWKGSKIEDIKAADIDYKKKEVKTEGKRFYLYNVGTGKFVSRGGDFGIRAYMTNRDFGCSMYLGKSTALKKYYEGKEETDENQIPDLIYSGIVGWAEGHSNNYFPYAFGINYPGITTENGSWGNPGSGQTFGPFLQQTPEMKEMGGFLGFNETWVRSRFYFERVETDPNAETVTYRLKELLQRGAGSSITNWFAGWESHWCYLGAKAGQNVEQANAPYSSNLGKEQVTFTEVSGENVECPDKTHYYEWRLVTEDEINSVLNANTPSTYGGGLLANNSSVVKDPFFYNGLDDDYNAGWTVTSTATAGTLNRYDWASDNSDTQRRISKYSGDVQGSFSTNKPWNAAVLRKIQFDAKDDSKYSYALFDGVGSCSQTVTVPKAGYYVVQIRGLYQGKPAYLFANNNEKLLPEATETLTKAVYDSVLGVKGSSTKEKYLYYHYKSDYESAGVNDKKGQDYYYKSEFRIRWQDVNASMSGLRKIGKDLYDNKYGETSVLVKVEDGNLNINFGVKKDDATKQEVQKCYHYRNVNQIVGAEWGSYNTSYEYYYYDTDIAAFDNIQIYYLGTEQPYVFDEGNDKETEVSSKFNDVNNTNKATYLKRTLTMNTWEPVVLPFNMTTAQVLEYFGDTARVAKLNGVNTITQKEEGVITIDFKTVQMENNLGVIDYENAIEAGQFYLVKATKAAHATQSITNSNDNYIVGRHNYAGNLPEKTHTYTYEGDDCNQLTAHGSYWKETKAVTPGQYYFNNGDLYRSGGTFDIKGFRGWLSAENVQTGEQAKLAFGFDSDFVVTFIDGVRVAPTSSVKSVYTIGGQLVRRNSTSTDGLPKGLYIVDGKKVIVK